MNLIKNIPGPILIFMGALSLSFGGIIVKSFDTIEISNAIEKFYKMPLKNKLKMGVKARKRIKSEFNIEKIVSIYENLIMSVTNGSIQK